MCVYCVNNAKNRQIIEDGKFKYNGRSEQDPRAVHIGVDDVEKYIGRVLVFHDDEVDSVNIDRDGTVKVRLWTWSDVDYEHFTFCVW